MADFTLQDVDYTCLYSRPNPGASYGLAITFWKSNINDLLFFLNVIDRYWNARGAIEISVCSAMELDENLLSQIRPIANYIISCSKDLGHQLGTTAHTNGAMYPLMQNDNIKTVTHTDADTIILNDYYFFGHADRVMREQKVILTSMPTYIYTHGHLMPHPSSLGRIDNQFGSTFVINKLKLSNSGYIPFPLRGHFEEDRCWWFKECGYTLNDAIIIPRYPLSRDSFTHDIDFSIGVMHSTNYPKNKKRNILGIMGWDEWDGMVL
jgi:hypothetical protein